MKELLFDDTYHGTRFTYGLMYRPLGSATVPPGWIIGSDNLHPDFCFGTVDYPFELPKATAESFELIFVGKKEA